MKDMEAIPATQPFNPCLQCVVPDVHSPQFEEWIVQLNEYTFTQQFMALAARFATSLSTALCLSGSGLPEHSESCTTFFPQ